MTAIQSEYEVAYLQSYAEFYDYTRKKRFYISDTLLREIGRTQWREMLNTYIGTFVRNKTAAMTPDEAYQEIAGLFPYLLPGDVYNEHDQLQGILNALERGREAKRILRTRLQGGKG